MARIGFVGLGHMGLPMAINLVQAGHTVTGYDLQPEALSAFSAAGGLSAHSLQQASQDQEIIITMLQTGQQVKQVCLGDKGLFAAASPQALFIDCSSIDVSSSRELHEQALNYKLLVVDSPVSGGVAGASAATLTFMVGGMVDALEAARPILACMGKKIIHTGKAGSGQAAKICNNMILGVSMIAVSEAFILGQQLGLEPEKLFDVVTSSSGQCWAMSHYAPVPGVLENVPANHDYKPGFSAAMMLKDLKLSQQSAAAVGVKTPMGERAAALYQQFNAEGMAGLDFSAIIKLLGNKD